MGNNELFTPENWKKINFGDVAKNVKNKVDAEESGLTRYIAGEHMETDNLRIKSWGNIGEGYLGPAFHRKFSKGQILYGSRRTYLRKVAIPHFDGVCANTTFVIEAKQELLPDLLPFIMQSERFTDHSIRNSKGSTNPYINWKDIAKYKFPLPPLDEQKRIAELLWAIENSIRKWEDTIELAERYKKALMKHLFTYGPVGVDEIDNIKLKKTKIGMVREDWDVLKIEEFVNIVMGQSPPGDTYNEDGNGMPFLQGRTEFGREHPNHEKFTTMPLKKAKKGSILMSIRAPVGDINYANINYCIGRGLASLSMKNKENNDFLFPLLEYYKYEFEKRGTGSTFKAITSKGIKNVKLPLPNKHEQLLIIQIINLYSKFFKNGLSHIKLLKNKKSHLLNQLLSGQIQLKGAEND